MCWLNLLIDVTSRTNKLQYSSLTFYLCGHASLTFKYQQFHSQPYDFVAFFGIQRIQVRVKIIKKRNENKEKQNEKKI